MTTSGKGSLSQESQVENFNLEFDNHDDQTSPLQMSSYQCFDQSLKLEGTLHLIARDFLNEPGASRFINNRDKCEFLITETATDFKFKLQQKNAQFIPKYSNFRKVTYLDISNCKIMELEGRVFCELISLVKLNAQRNQIRYLSGQISECQRLTHILLD